MISQSRNLTKASTTVPNWEKCSPSSSPGKLIGSPPTNSFSVGSRFSFKQINWIHFRGLNDLQRQFDVFFVGLSNDRHLDSSLTGKLGGLYRALVGFGARIHNQLRLLWLRLLFPSLFSGLIRSASGFLGQRCRSRCFLSRFRRAG